MRASRSASRAHAGASGYRAFTDSAPVLEKALARDAGLGWIGKHTNLLDRHDGSWFFLGEIYTDLPLPIDAPVDAHCGTCTACIDVCPTHAIVAPYELDARRCISYLTIEHAGPIPEEFRAAIGNRIYGCDDCQLVCPWNRYAQADRPNRTFAPRHGLDAPRLVELFVWSEDEFLAHTEGSAIRRIGYERWLRNVAVALGNAPTTPEVIAALRSRAATIASELVREHVAWALQQHARATRSELRCGPDEHPGPRHCRLSISRALPRRPAVEHDEVEIWPVGSRRAIRRAHLEIVGPNARRRAAPSRPSASIAATSMSPASIAATRAIERAVDLRRRARAPRASGSDCANSAPGRPRRAPSAHRRSSRAGTGPARRGE